MPCKTRRVLFLYTDKYYLIKQVYPYGLDIMADYLRQYGHEVFIESPFLAGDSLEDGVKDILERVDPDVIGLGIRNLDTAMSCEEFGNYEGKDFRTFYFLPEIERIVQNIRSQLPEMPIVVGGGAFTVSPEAILKKLGVSYGILGEGEAPLQQFLQDFPDERKISKIAGMAIQKDDQIFVTPRQPYLFRPDEAVILREKKFNYAFETVGIPIQLKRGCNQSCSYCVEPIIEGTKIVFRNTDNVLSELYCIDTHHKEVRSVFFTDTEFNIPNAEYGKALIRRIMNAGLNKRFRFSSQFLPKPFDVEFARLLKDAGFSVILTCDSFSDHVLEENLASFRQKDIINTLELCEKYEIDCSVNLIFGLPGETHGTIDHTLEKMLAFPPNAYRRYEYTIGGRIYRGTPLCRLVEKQAETRNVYGQMSQGYLEPLFYCSPANPSELKKYIDRAVSFSLEFQNSYDEVRCRVLRLSYLIDQCRWQTAETNFMSGHLAAQTSIYDYFFRKLVAAGNLSVAKRISEHVIEKMLQEPERDDSMDRVSVIQYYLSLLEAAEHP